MALWLCLHDSPRGGLSDFSTSFRQKSLHFSSVPTSRWCRWAPEKPQSQALEEPQSGEAKSDTFALSSTESSKSRVLCLKSPEGCLEEGTQSWGLMNECARTDARMGKLEANHGWCLHLWEGGQVGGWVAG